MKTSHSFARISRPALARLTALVATLALSFTCACSGSRGRALSKNRGALEQESDLFHLAIVGTNDLHGRAEPVRQRLPGGHMLELGGLATFSGQLELLRSAFPQGLLLFDAGDIFEGTLLSDRREGLPIVDAYNLLGYDAAAVGNHDFSYGPVGPAAYPTRRGDDPLGALKVLAKRARFPFLARNVRASGESKSPTPFDEDGMLMLERGGFKIGVVGLTTQSTASQAMAANLDGLEIAPLKQAALSAARALTRSGAHVKVLLLHGGANCPKLEDPRNTDACKRDGDLFRLLEAMPEGTFDVVIAGHTHHQVGHFIQGAAVIETPGNGTHFGWVELVLSRSSGTIQREQTRIHAMQPICDQKVVGQTKCGERLPESVRRGEPAQLEPALFLERVVRRDSELARQLAPHAAEATRISERPLGVELPRTLTRKGGALGEAIADALLQMESADVVILNPGTLRADLKKGLLHYGELYEALPFDNKTAILQLTGTELTAMLSVLSNNGRRPPITAGLTCTYGKRRHGRHSLEKVTLVSGEPLEPELLYRVVTSDFLARGGSGLAAFIATVPTERVDPGATRDETMRDELANWILRQQGTWP